MIFEEGTSVIYKEMDGVIDFICSKYVVIKVNSTPNQTSPRLIVFTEDYKNITKYEK